MAGHSNIQGWLIGLVIAGALSLVCLVLVLLLPLLFIGTPGLVPSPTPTIEPVLQAPVSLDIREITPDLDLPVYLTHAGDDRLFVVEREGDIHIIEDGTVQDVPFLDLSARVYRDTFRKDFAHNGLMSLAFHPNYVENGRFFVTYLGYEGDAVLSEYRVSENPALADFFSEQVLVTIPMGGDRDPEVDVVVQNDTRHVAFGPDGYLYFAVGDALLNEDLMTVERSTALPATIPYGTIMRLDVDGESPYAIPPDNPFADGEDGLPEVWGYGLRNPWHFSFDRITGWTYITDLGEQDWDEINALPPDTPAGQHFGWSYYEGPSVLFGEMNPHPRPDSVPPTVPLRHEEGGLCAVIGGYVYRGSAIPGLQGAYVYSDHCTGDLYAAYRDISGVWQTETLLETAFGVSAIGEGHDGELYLVTLEGFVFQVIQNNDESNQEASG